jgi:hypothetical protein
MSGTCALKVLAMHGLFPGGEQSGTKKIILESNFEVQKSETDDNLLICIPVHTYCTPYSCKITIFPIA